MAVERGTYYGSRHSVAGGDLDPLLDPPARGNEGRCCSVKRVNMRLVDSVGLLDKDSSAPTRALTAFSQLL